MSSTDTDADEARIRELHAGGASVPEMARELARPELWVRRRLKRLDLPPPSQVAAPTEPLDEALRIRCSTRQLADLDERARAAGVERSELVRRLLWPAG